MNATGGAGGKLPQQKQNATDRIIAVARDRRGSPTLFAVSLAESVILPIPPDLLLIPMCAAKRENAWRFATYATLGSIIGGCIAYAIGTFFWNAFGENLAQLVGDPNLIDAARTMFRDNGVIAAVIGAITPIPFKLTALVAGVADMNFPLFVTVVALARGARFFALAAAVKCLGNAAERFLSPTNASLAAILAAAVVVGGLLLIDLLVEPPLPSPLRP